MTVRRNFIQLYKVSCDPWHADVDSPPYEGVLDLLRKLERKPRAILDLGCGNGAFSAKIKKLFPDAEVFGLDVSPNAIAEASQRHAGITFFVNDIRKIDQKKFCGKRFDLILMLDLLYYFSPSEQRSILKSIKGILASGGYLLVRSWTPGGLYLTHEETKSLVGEFFTLYEERRSSETGHSFFLFRKLSVPFVWTIDYETWQPLPQGKIIDWDADVFEPTERLLNFADKENIKLSFMAEMGEYYWLKENRPEIALRMESQWKEIIRRGHDVQIHLHPSWLPECEPSFDGSGWRWNTHFQRIHEYPGNVEALLKRCKNDLEAILKPVNPEYEAIVFRAGKYQIQPSKEIAHAFLEAGIVADTSVWKGGSSTEHRFDFRTAFSGTQPYPASLYNVNYAAPPNEKYILELPIFSFEGKRLMFDGARSPALISLVEQYRSAKRVNLFRYRTAWLPNVFARAVVKVFRFRKAGDFLIYVYDKIWEKIMPCPAFFHTFPEVFLAISHTKQPLYLRDISEFLAYLRREDCEMEFPRIRDVARRFANDLERRKIDGGTRYEDCLRHQVEYDKAAIMGETRNWQQSFYAQEMIPLDRTKILDIGCGTGYWTKRLNDTIAETIGVDIGEEFIAKAKQVYSDLEFHVMDFHDLRFPDASFDCVYADNVLEHSPFPQKAFHEIFRVLKNRGFLLALIPPDARNAVLSGSDHLWKTDKDEVEARLLTEGFTGIEIEDINTRKLGMASYKPSNDSMLIVKAWKWDGGYSQGERVRDIMRWCYKKLAPARSHTSQEPQEIIKEGFAWCEGYMRVMRYACEREGFKTREWTLYCQNHPKGRGVKKIDTHEVLEVFIDGRWILFDPTTNVAYGKSLSEIIAHPEIVDKIIDEAARDERWRARRYDLYASSWFYKNLCRIERRTLVNTIIKKVKHYAKTKASHFFPRI